MLVNCGVGEYSWESLGLQGDPTSPEHSLEGLMLKLKLQYFAHLMWRADSFQKTLMLGNIESRRERDGRGWDGWMALSTQCLGVDDGQGSLACCSPRGHKESKHDLATEQQYWSIRQLEELHNMYLFIISGRQLNTTSCHLYGSNRD